ncbi:hypothetical protein Tco_0997281, partial [Tanacetum coccineum]
TGVALGIKSIWNSTWRTRGRPGRSSGKTFGNSLTTGISSRYEIYSVLWSPRMINVSPSMGMASNCHWYQITSSGWPFVSAVLSQMAHLVANITLNSGGSISPEGFLSLVLLWLVIIVAVVGVMVVVVIIVAVVVVVESSFVVKLSFVIT